MSKPLKPLAFKCPGCSADFIKNDYIIIHACCERSAAIDIVAECPSCHKNYRYLASMADLKGEDAQ